MSDNNAGEDSADIAIVEVNGIKWITGLRWDTRDGPVTRAVARAETNARQASYYVLRPDTQFATATAAPGVKLKMPSLATALAETSSQGNVLGAFRLPDDKYYLYAVRDLKIVPGYDNVYNVREATNKFDQLFTDPNWTTKYAPVDWSYADAVPSTLAEITPIKPPPVSRLREPSRRSDVMRLLPVAAVLLLAFGAYKGYGYYQERLEQQRMQEAAREAAAQRAQLDRLNKVVWPPMPSEATRRGIAVAERCIEFMRRSVPTRLPGWDATKSSCDGQSVKVELDQEQGFGTVNWIAPAVAERWGTPRLNISAAAHKATLTWPLDTAAVPVWGKIDGQDPERLTNYMNSQFGEMYQEPKIEPSVRPTITVKTVGGKNVPATAPWSVMTVTMETSGPVQDDHVAILERLQNTRLVSVERNLRDDKWTTKFEIYHVEPPIPPRVD